MKQYIEIFCGFCFFIIVWVEYLFDEVKCCFYKNWYKFKKKVFIKYVKKYFENSGVFIICEFECIKKYCIVVCVFVYIQICKIFFKQKKVYFMEIQINGGFVVDKVEFGYGFFEKFVFIDIIFEKDEMIDVIVVIKGYGFSGVIVRWGIKKFFCKIYKGFCKVVCIGVWYFFYVQWIVVCVGQMGYYYCILVNYKVYCIGKGDVDDNVVIEIDVIKKIIILYVDFFLVKFEEFKINRLQYGWFCLLW